MAASSRVTPPDGGQQQGDREVPLLGEAPAMIVVDPQGLLPAPVVVLEAERAVRLGPAAGVHPGPPGGHRARDDPVSYLRQALFPRHPFSPAAARFSCSRRVFRVILSWVTVLPAFPFRCLGQPPGLVQL